LLGNVGGRRDIFRPRGEILGWLGVGFHGTLGTTGVRRRTSKEYCHTPEDRYK
jgi:hypothetical protein